MSLICSNCQTENPAGGKFCTECATPLASPCPSCGTANLSNAKFCSECATPLAAGAGATPARSASPATSAAPSPVAERRVVSILFADLVGFTPFAEERDSEEVRESLTKYFDVARQVIERYGGTIEKFIGDAVMAVWGVPVAHEDDAERAVRSALDLVQAVKALGPGIEARAGVLTGEVAVTLGATDQGMVAGDLVNTASRLQGAAPPGTVLVGEATQRSASAGIVFEPAGEQMLKGKTAPVAAWHAVRVAGGIRGRWRTEGPEAPFVGRTEELALLKDLYHATARENHARLVSVIGPAGIGKSRLGRELLNHIDAEAEDFWLHHGRSPAYGEGLTFWALGEMIRQRAGLAETDDEPTTRSRVRAMLDEHVPDEADRRWIEPPILSLLGLEGGATDTEQLFGAWRTFFERLAAASPVVLVFEDLHWADSGMLDFIDNLLEWSRSQPIFILTLARPELLERRPTWGAGKRQFTSVYLEPLPEPAIRELLAGLVPGLPETAARAIAARADGIPLYAVETVRMLVADGRLVEDGGVYQPSGDLTELAVPETLTALIASRLDALDPEARALAQDASVLGQRFTVAGLAAVSGLETAAFEPRLETLVRRELLSRETDPRSPERNQYGFVQSLIREVAYNTLARRDRKSRHLAAARFFESLETDELAGALAGQYVSAHANADGPDETTALAAQARVALRAAAERASGLGAPDQAFGFLSQALAMAIDPVDEAELALRAGQAATAGGRYHDGEPVLRRAKELFTAAGDQDGTDRAVTALATNLIEAARFTDAIELLEPVMAETEDFGQRPYLIAAGGQLARAHMLQIEPARAIAAADRVLPAAEHADMGSLVADLLVTKGTALSMARRVREGLALITAGKELGESLGAHSVTLRALMNQAFSLEWVSPREAYAGSQAGLALSRRVGHRGFVLNALFNAVGGAIHVGEWDWAATELMNLLEMELDGSDRLLAATAAGSFRAVRGEPRQDLVDEARRADTKELAVRVVVEAALAYDALADGRLDEARSRFEVSRKTNFGFDDFMWTARIPTWQRDEPALAAALEALREAGRHGETADALRLTMKAGLAALRASTDEALQFYRQARDGWDDLGLRWDLALLGIDMAVLLDHGLPEVGAAIARSRAILTELGARPFLERLEAEVARSGTAATLSGEAQPIPMAESEVTAG
ncbi:MAG: adenylate/guanylate cyclase domain-containing protein [Chloroflexota bacterium]